MDLTLKILIVIVCWILADRVVHFAFTQAAKIQRLPAVTLGFLERAARVGLLIFAALVLSQVAGLAPTELWSGVTTLLALLGVGFVAFWSVLSNAVCGLLLLFTRPFKVGDDIEIFDTANGSDKPGIQGTVVDITGFYLVLRAATADGRSSTLFVPHNFVFQKAVRVIH